MTIQVGSMTFSTHSSNDSQPESLMACLPRWGVKLIEATMWDARNPSIGQQTHSKKQCGSVSLMECVLDTCDLYTYIDAHAVPKCENVVIVKLIPWRRIRDGKLFPDHKEIISESVDGSIRPILPLMVLLNA